MARHKWLRITIVMMVVGALVGVLAGCSGGAANADSDDAAKPDAENVALTVSAAPVLTDALTEIADTYMDENAGVTITLNFAASGTLQAQIEQGAPVDLFFSGAQKQMDPLDSAGLLAEGTRVNILTNDIVVVVPTGSDATVSTLADLLSEDIDVIAIGDPKTVTAGMYAQQSLDAAGITDAVLAKSVLAKDVREALTYVETKNADAGFVYATDAMISDDVKVAMRIPADTHDAIVYPAAVIGASPYCDAAEAFLRYLSTDQAMEVFERYGFSSAQ